MNRPYLEVVCDEDPPDVELDVLSLLAVLVEALRGLVDRDEEERLEGDLALGDEVRLRQGAVRVLRDRLVEFGVLIVLDLGRLPVEQVSSVKFG